MALHKKITHLIGKKSCNNSGELEIICVASAPKPHAFM